MKALTSDMTATCPLVTVGEVLTMSAFATETKFFGVNPTTVLDDGKACSCFIFGCGLMGV